MHLFSLVLVNLGRNRLRTLLTMSSITVALFLFCALGGVLDTLPGIQRVAVQNWFGGRDPANPHEFFAQFAVDPENFFPMYRNEFKIVDASAPQAEVSVPPGVDPKLAAFLGEQTACVVSEEM